MPYCMIIGTFSVDPGILVSLYMYESTYYPYTTLAIYW